MDDRDGRLAALLGRLALHRRDENLAAALAGLLANLDLGLTDPLGDLRHQLAFDAADHLDAGLLLGKRGDPLELLGDQGALILDRLAQGLELGFTTGQPLLVGVQLAEPALEPLLALVGPLLEPRDLRPALANLRLGLVPAACGLLLRGEQHRFCFLLDRADLLETAFSVRVVRDPAFRHGSARVDNRCSRKCGRNNHQPCQGEDLDADGMEPRRSGAMRPAWNASRREGDRGETHSVSRSGRGRPAVAGRSRREDDPIVRAKGVARMFRSMSCGRGYP